MLKPLVDHPDYIQVFYGCDTPGLFAVSFIMTQQWHF